MKNFKITSMHSVYIDSYEQGELESVNNYDMKETVKAETVKDAIIKYVENSLFYSFDYDSAEIDEESNLIHWSNLVNVDNEEVTSKDAIYSQWKKGKATLYNNQYSMSVEELTTVKLTK